MNFKVLSVAALVISTICFSGVSSAEKMPESPKQKERRIESNLTSLFKDAVKAAAVELDQDHKMAPFAIVMKKNGTFGFLTIDDKKNETSIDQQVASIRALLIDMASTQQIDATVQVLYAEVSNKEGDSHSQGLVFEIEHRDGVSMMRFLPVSEMTDDKGVKNGDLVFEVEKLSTGSKPQTIFVASIVQ